MELRVEKVTFPEAIEFNFEELRTEITTKVSDYANLVYTDDQIKEAKADRAKLNSFTKALSDERIRVKKQCMKPYEDFERKVKELEDIVKKASENIDNQVKGYEDKKKAEKLEAIKTLWSEMVHPEGLPFEKVFQQKFLNTTCSMKVVKQWFSDAIDKYNDDMAVLKELERFSFEAIEEYHRSFNLTIAIQEGKRLEDMQRRKEEMAKRQKEAEEAERIRKEKEAAEQEVKKSEAEFAQYMNPPVPEKEWISFKALLSEDDASALANFFASRNIEFEPI